MKNSKNLISALTGLFTGSGKQKQTEPVWRSSAGAHATNEFINIYTYSGYRLLRQDPTAQEYIFPLAASDKDLGDAIKKALSQSRFLSLEEAKALDCGADDRYSEWELSIMERFGYKSKRAMYKNMKYCTIEISDGVLKISPTRHEKLQSWGRDKRDEIEDVVIPLESPPTEIGDALRLAFDRCID